MEWTRPCFQKPLTAPELRVRKLAGRERESRGAGTATGIDNSTVLIHVDVHAQARPDTYVEALAEERNVRETGSASAEGNRDKTNSDEWQRVRRITRTRG